MGFEAYRQQGKKKAWVGCSRCGKEGKADGTVDVSLRDRTEVKIATLASTSRSMCEPCTVQTYEETVVFMLSKMK